MRDELTEEERKILRTRSPLTRRESDALDFLRSHGTCDVRGYAAHRNISYPAAYDILERLKTKGRIHEEWATKGNVKRYRYASGQKTEKT